MENKSKFENSVILNNGIKMPLIGLGTYKLEDLQNSIKSAILNGYMLFDTASLYNNEVELGNALKICLEEKLIKREDLFICTKLWNDDHEDPVKALKSSLMRLDMDYVDLYLIHWPIGKIENNEIKQIPLHITWSKMEECVKLGLAKSIGVSNFNVQILLDLMSYANIKPVCNQVELHPYLSQNDLVNFCSRYNIVVQAYNPILRGSYVQRKVELFKKNDLFENEDIKSLALKYNKEPAQIILNWHAKRGVCTLPKSSNSSRQLQNILSLEFKMEENDYMVIDKLNKNFRFNNSEEKSFSNGINLFA